MPHKKMSPERWQQIQGVFDKARSYGPNERRALLDEACTGDKELRAEVEWMLTHQDEAENLMPAPALELAAKSVAAETGTLLGGSSLGPYEDLQLIGRGGMSEVYSARDPRLKRSIALKVLPEEMAVDPERYARFEREAHAVAALNHPNIVTIHSVEQAEGVHFLTMELVEGKTLAEMILPPGMAVDQIFQIAIPIADAISAAHSQGITHRDLKPTNIMVSRDGRVKVLDFGLAKLSVGEVANDITTLPAKPLTRDGRILGTVSYMSPEQAEGKQVDPRSDIFSLGIILYELATGERPFKGDTRVSVLSSIMKDTPRPVTEINPALPLEFVRILRRCLAKDPAHRYQTAIDLRNELEELKQDLSGALAQGSVRQLPGGQRHKWRIAMAAGLAVLLLFIAAFLWRRTPATQPVQPIRLEIVQPSEQLGPAVAFVSPDGSKVAFTASDGKTRRLWVRPLDALDARPLDGTEGAGLLFWSGDSQFIGFAAQGKLEKIPASGGPATFITKIPNGFTGGFWTEDGGILFTTDKGSGDVLRVPSGGGSPVSVKLNGMKEDSSPAFPVALPDGRHFLFCDCFGISGSGIYVASIDGKEQVKRRIVDVRSRIAYSPSSNGRPGYVLFFQGNDPHGNGVFAELGGTLMALPLEDDGSTAPGEAVAVAEQVSNYSFSVSKTGVLVYGTANSAVSSGGPGATYGQLTWFDRQGHITGTLGDSATHRVVAISPDGKRAAVETVDPQSKNMDVWLYELAHGTNTRFTFHPDRFKPVWSADSTRLLYATVRRGTGTVWYERASDMASDEKQIFMLKGGASPSSWSPDGRFVLYGDLSIRSDVWALDLQSSERKPLPVVQSPGNDINARFSPDGKWISYASNESGTYEIFVKPFIPPSEAGSTGEGGKRMISKGSAPGGAVWRGDGKELFYISGDHILMSCEVTTTPNFSAQPPKPLFKVPSSVVWFGVTPDGNRFLMPIPPSSNSPRSFKVVLNWTSALKK
jgi:Tol biopolymer transport system component